MPDNKKIIRDALEQMNRGDLNAFDSLVTDDYLVHVAARDADQRCCCTFPWLTSFMTALLEAIQTIVGNYGVAIMVLVVIIRVLLHPLAVFQQKSMYRMQDAQARLKPKLDAIKEKYPNDKMKVNQETMKLYSEEGVNPMASMVGMLPMMIQMPILIVLAQPLKIRYSSNVSLIVEHIVVAIQIPGHYQTPIC